MSKKGKPYTIFNIRSHGEFYSAFKNQWNSHWKAGMEIEAEIQEEVGANGKIYKNIVPPPRSNDSGSSRTPTVNHDTARLNEISSKLDKVIAMLAASTGQNQEDVPF